MNKVKIYLSGGFHSGWQEEIMKYFPVSEFPNILFCNPFDFKSDNPKLFGPMDKVKIEQCDILFAYLEETNPTALAIIAEMAYAKGRDKMVIFCNEWDDEGYKVRGLKARYMALIEEWVDFVEKDFGHAIDLLKGVVRF